MQKMFPEDFATSLLILAAERCYYGIKEAVVARISNKSTAAAADSDMPVVLGRTSRRTGECVCDDDACT